MRRFVVLAMLSMVFTTVCAESAKAQYPSRIRAPRAPSYRFRLPTTSPYLDLLGGSRRGRNFSQEYVRRVRPEMEFRQASAQLSRSIADLNSQMARQRQMRLQEQQRQMRPAGILQPIASGHPTTFLRPDVRFLNYGGYYSSVR